MKIEGPSPEGIGQAHEGDVEEDADNISCTPRVQLNSPRVNKSCGALSSDSTPSK